MCLQRITRIYKYELRHKQAAGDYGTNGRLF